MALSDRFKKAIQEERKRDAEQQVRLAGEREEAALAERRERFARAAAQQKEGLAITAKLQNANERLGFAQWIRDIVELLDLEDQFPDLKYHSDHLGPFLALKGVERFNRIGTSLIIGYRRGLETANRLTYDVNNFDVIDLFLELAGNDGQVVVHIGPTELSESEFLNDEDKVLEATKIARANPRTVKEYTLRLDGYTGRSWE